ncbi:hypothetical protein V8F06_007108 [Rhypophila decipiens]
MAQNATTHWALLIGCNAIPRHYDGGAPSCDQSDCMCHKGALAGAVADAIALNKYISGLPISIDIETLVDDSLSHHPLPTWENVVSRLSKIIEQAKDGHFVYIHFSGHGERIPVIEHRFPAVALTLLDKPLYGKVLRSALILMVKKKIHVTLVLDCCFSGSVLRSSEQDPAVVRFLERHKKADRGSFVDDPFSIGMHDLRTAKSVSRSVLEPDGYTVITACGPHEVARELVVDGDRRGALSYFLVDALAALNGGRSGLFRQDILFQHLRAMFLAHNPLPQQMPMLYGTNDICFFGYTAPGSESVRIMHQYVSVFWSSKEKRLLLDAGQAHGVQTGDLYEMYPYQADDSVSPDERAEMSIRVVVKSVHGLQSEVAPAHGFQQPSVERSLTWKARRIRPMSSNKVPVFISPGFAVIGGLQALDECPHVRMCTGPSPDEETCLFTVTVNSNSCYEVQDATLKPIPDLPIIHLGDSEGLGRLADTLDHLATFKVFEAIQNNTPHPPFEQSFSVRCSKAQSANGTYQVCHEEKLTFTFTVLNGDAPRYFTVFNLDSDWGISNVNGGGDGDYIVVLPKWDSHAAMGENTAGYRERYSETGEETITLTMTVPAHAHEAQRTSGKVEDLLKIFITSGPIRFPRTILPAIGNGAFRGDNDQVGEVMKGLSSSGNRAGEGYWACKTFIIWTSL